MALLHQRQRARATDGSVIATIADYAHARDLLLSVFESLAADGVTAAVRETVEAVQPGEELTEADLVRRLGMAKSSVSYPWFVPCGAAGSRESRAGRVLSASTPRIISSNTNADVSTSSAKWC